MALRMRTTVNGLIVTLLLMAGVGMYVLVNFPENKNGLRPHYVTRGGTSRVGLHTSHSGLKTASPYLGQAVTLQPDADEEGSRKVMAPPFWKGELNLTTEELSWFVPKTSRRLDEVRHIVFVKVHKAAGTTLGTVFQRFAKSRALNVMLPASGERELSQHAPGVGRLAPHPKSPPFLFDIAYSHVVFHHDVMSPYFPPDTTYVAIMREPFQQVRSSFYYFHIQNSTTNTPSFEEFVRNQSRYEKGSPYRSYTNNRQSIDMGLDARHLGNASRVLPLVRRLAAQFHLVLIQESFPQSLVLMRRVLRWTMKDVLYLDTNVGENKPRTPTFQPDEPTRGDFQRFQMFDVAVYQHFLAVFQRKVAEQGPDFEDELKVFQRVQKRVSLFCVQAEGDRSPALVIPSSRWNEEFTFRSAECWALSRGIWDDEVFKRQMQRLFPGQGSPP